jgi:hypothetical protein
LNPHRKFIKSKAPRYPMVPEHSIPKSSLRRHYPYQVKG